MPYKVKHGISFEEAQTVFYDNNALLIADPEHSNKNDNRFVMLGLSFNLRLLVVCHCYREGDIIRIISARKATKTEGKQYGGQL
ncbi:hypothetical protein HMPREF9194_01322 [Treponema maltophilum ATCC 51939]|uniref:BrnT family toxin n=1 Tax=Treponema maltophilum ATCC 51939 TaxID=1125699 RepID=S3JYB2_TREMA|nr:BrnT family toxin [Treponema maltophilum]EPF30993.1 hypothetical protein HMPREF9194_01322 [Treponema maltophilum ATCC 51939]